MSARPTRRLPASQRKPTLYTPLVVQELAQLESDLGGRAGLVGMLVLAPLTPDLRYVLGLLGDPRSAMLPLADICAQGNLLPGDLLGHLASAALLKGKVRASQVIAAGIAAVASDIMLRAAPYEDPCNGPCQGTGYLAPQPTAADPNPDPVPCPVCKGGGVLKYRPDLERQKLAVEMAQLLPKGGGINIAQITATGSGGGGSTASGGLLEHLQRATDRLLYGSGEGIQEEDVVEGEALRSDPPADPPV